MAYTQSGLHHHQWRAPKVAYTTRRGPHHHQWRAPKVAYTTRCGPHQQQWHTPKVACGEDVLRLVDRKLQHVLQ